jgi:hypothetical protein
VRRSCGDESIAKNGEVSKTELFQQVARIPVDAAVDLSRGFV